jgi:hypothetical protein
VCESAGLHLSSDHFNSPPYGVLKEEAKLIEQLKVPSGRAQLPHDEQIREAGFDCNELPKESKIDSRSRVKCYPHQQHYRVAKIGAY